MNKDYEKSVDDMLLKEISALAGSGEVTLKQIQMLFPDMNKKTISWYLYKFVQEHKLIRTGHGVYSILKQNANRSMGYDYLSEKAKKVYSILEEYGYDYYISGIDALAGELLHMTESHPIIIVVEEAGIREIQEILIEEDFLVATEKEKNRSEGFALMNKVEIIIFKGKNFDLSYNAIAMKEKAFTDLYYAVTRLNYPMSVQELKRTYENMIRNNQFKRRMIMQSARERKILNEIELIYDSEKMTEKSISFLQMQLDGVANNGREYN